MQYKILIVDDEKNIFLMLRSFFESKNYLVLTSLNGRDELCQVEHQPDIIPLDIDSMF